MSNHAEEIKQQLEEIAASWDGCETDAPGGMLDVGAQLRKQFAALSAQTLPEEQLNKLLRLIDGVIARSEEIGEEEWYTAAELHAISNGAISMPDAKFIEAMTPVVAFGLVNAASPSPSKEAVQPSAPMDWPLPCDVTVGAGTIRKGVPLRVLVTRIEVLHEFAMAYTVHRATRSTTEQEGERIMSNRDIQIVEAALKAAAEAFENCWVKDVRSLDPAAIVASVPVERQPSVFLANLHYFFAQTDGAYAWPAGSVGDLLKQAKKEIESLLSQAPQAAQKESERG